MGNNFSDAKTWAAGHQSPYQLRDITHFPDWGRLIVLDAFFNNLTSGLMLATALVWLAGAPMLAALVPAALSAALLLLIIDLCILVKDLGDPMRFFHALRVMRFTSPLSVGVWGLACYGAFLGIAVLLAWIMTAIGGFSGVAGFLLAAVLRVCVVMAVLAACVVICYKGVVFSCSSQPGVCQARWLTPFMVSDSLLMGMSVFALLCAIFSPDGTAALLLILPLAILLCARCVTFGLLWQDVKPRAAKINSASQNRAVAIMVYGVGGLLPLLLLFCGSFGMAVAAVLILAAGYQERAFVIGLARPLKVAACAQPDAN